jgi:oligopeptide/dipeptide ABC transporter ATP-binding protein
MTGGASTPPTPPTTPASPDQGPALTVRHATCHFDVSPPWLDRVLRRAPRRILRAVEDVSFTLARGKTFSVVGESGCGKSTLARMVVGLRPPTRGEISFGTVTRPDGSIVPPRVQMIFQDPYASLNPRWRVGDIIAEPIRELKLMTDEARITARIAELLATVGLSPADAGRFPHEFSGGQRQRISIARALATEADLLVCDEPTSALDVSVQAQILNLMRRLQQDFNLTYLFISHNLSVVRHMSDEIAIMYLGRFVETGPADEIFTAPRHPYTRLLLETIPNVETPNRNRQPMVGEVPSPIAPPPGCPFHPRCSLATARCREELPELRQEGTRQLACHEA